MDAMELPNLHDFVLNLLSDPTALQAFNLDPATVLDSAGLGDISAADVSEVVPLVMDLLPMQNTQVVDTALSSLTSLDSVGSGQAGAIAQLQNVTAVLSSITTDASQLSGGGTLSLNTPLGAMGGVLSADSHGLDLGFASPMGSADLNAASDVADVLDSQAQAGIAQLNGAISEVTSEAGALSGGFGGFSTVTDTLSAEFSNGASEVTGAVQSLAGTLSNPTAALSELSNPSAAFMNGAATVESAINSAVAPLAAAPGGDVVVGMVSNGEAVINSAVSEAASHLNPAAVTDLASHATDPSYLAGSAEGAISTATDTVNTVASQIPGGSAVTGVTGQLTGALSDPSHALSTVTGALSDPSHALSTVTDTVNSVAGQIPGASAVTNTLSEATNTLTHAASDSPLSGLTSTVSGLAGTATDAAGAHTDPSASGHSDAGLLGDLHL